MKSTFKTCYCLFRYGATFIYIFWVRGQSGWETVHIGSRPIADKYREGRVKRTLESEVPYGPCCCCCCYFYCYYYYYYYYYYYFYNYY